MHDGQPAVHSQSAIASAVDAKPLRRRGEAAFGKSGPAVVAVVDEDGEPAGLARADRSTRRRRPSGRRRRPAAAGRWPRARPRARRPAGRSRPAASSSRWAGEIVQPHRPGTQRPGRQVERVLADRLAGLWLPRVKDTTCRVTRTSPKCIAASPQSLRSMLGGDLYVGQLARRGDVAGIAGLNQGDAVGQVQARHEVELALMRVDGAGMQRARAPTARPWCRSAVRWPPRRS